MKCPHCQTSIHDQRNLHDIINHKSLSFSTAAAHCPECSKPFIFLIRYSSGVVVEERLIYPKIPSRAIPPEVPDQFAQDFREACLVLDDSAKASAAISRRCLQSILISKAGAKGRELGEDIEHALANSGIPSHLHECLDQVRVIGNYATHPKKSSATGEIVEVEPGEAEWNLETLESLFDFYFVLPERAREKREALEKKFPQLVKSPKKQI